jgi:hypothetical protein
MAFCVGEIPRIFIMMVAIELGFLFKENSGLVNGKRLTPQRLIDFHEVGNFWVWFVEIFELSEEFYG